MDTDAIKKRCFLYKNSKSFRILKYISIFACATSFLCGITASIASDAISTMLSFMAGSCFSVFISITSYCFAVLPERKKIDDEALHCLAVLKMYINEFRNNNQTTYDYIENHAIGEGMRNELIAHNETFSKEFSNDYKIFVHFFSRCNPNILGIAQHWEKKIRKHKLSFTSQADNFSDYLASNIEIAKELLSFESITLDTHFEDSEEVKKILSIKHQQMTKRAAPPSSPPPHDTTSAP